MTKINTTLNSLYYLAFISQSLEVIFILPEKREGISFHSNCDYAPLCG